MNLLKNPFNEPQGFFTQGSSINDIPALGGRGQGFCELSLIVKKINGEGGVKN